MTEEGRIKQEIQGILEENLVFKTKDVIASKANGVSINGYYTMPSSNGYGEAGIADFLCCIKGVYIEIEAKAEGGSLRGIQKIHQSVVTNSGGVYHVVKGDGDVEILRTTLPLWINQIKKLNSDKI